MDKIIIAIDGNSSSGKSTLAKCLARDLKYRYIDSGAMYRAATLYCIRKKLIRNFNEQKISLMVSYMDIDFKYDNENGKSITYLNGEDVSNEIRTVQVSDKVSKISTIPQLRSKLVSVQQAWGKDKGVVMDGRDIGTVVFPKAELKIFVTASLDVRATRRYEELLVNNSNEVTLDWVKKNLKERDCIDENREIAPAKKPKDAIVLDNSNITIDQQLEWALNRVKTWHAKNM